MPPRSYVVTAVVLVVLVAVSIPLTMGFSVILWRPLFMAAACILGAAGAFRIVLGLRAPLWIGVVLALPGIFWLVDSLVTLTINTSAFMAWFKVFNLANQLALLLAATGAMQLMELVSTPHPAFRVAYGLLAASALLFLYSLMAQSIGWGFARDGLVVASIRSLHFAAILVAYGAFVGAALLIVTRLDIELWTGAVIGLIGVYMSYEIIRPMLAAGLRGDSMFWLLPILLLAGAAAVWRIGSTLHAHAGPVRYAQG
jgi:hypothetical protein